MPTKKKRKKRTRAKIDVNQILLQSRQLFLFGKIEEKLSIHIVQSIIALDKIKHAPIILHINSAGGYVSEGFSIIDAISGVRSPIITLITGKACSMAGLISVAGQGRLMTKNSVWMAHDMSARIIDYATKIADRSDFYKEEQKRIFNFLRTHTKLSEKEITQARNGELWLYPKQCKLKGIVDEVLGERTKTK